MIILRPGEKRDVVARVTRGQGSASGAIPASDPQRTILDAHRLAIHGYDWAAASWDAGRAQCYTTFDTTAVCLSEPGTYYVRLRVTIGSEIYAREVRVDVLDWCAKESPSPA